MNKPLEEVKYNPKNIKLIQNKAEKRKTEKTNTKMVDLNSTISIIILHINSLNTSD